MLWSVERTVQMAGEVEMVHEGDLTSAFIIMFHLDRECVTDVVRL